MSQAQPTDSGMPLADSSSSKPQDSLLSPSRPNSKNQHSSLTSTATTANNASLVEENEAAKGSKRRRRGDGASIRSSQKPKQGGASKFFSSLLGCCRAPDSYAGGVDENARKAERPRTEPRDKARVPAEATAGKSKEQERAGTPPPPPKEEQETKLNEKVPIPAEEAPSAPATLPTKEAEEPSLAKSSTESTNGEAKFPRTPEMPTTPPPPAPEAPENNLLPPAIIQEQQTQGTSTTATEPEYPSGPSVTHTPPTPHPDEGKSDETSLPAVTTTASIPSDDKRKSTSSVRPTTPIETDESDADSLSQETGAADVGMVPVPVPAEILPSEDQKSKWLLPPIAPEHTGKKCLVLDLDETLVHSSFRQLLQQPDFTIPVEIEGSYHNIYVIKRPGVDQFMKRVGELYEVVVFTASVSKYGDPLLDQLDIHSVVHHRLFRDSCYNHQGNYVKDLSQLGRDLKDTIIIDNSPTSYIFHPQHALPVSSWFSDAHDNELLDLIPVLEDLATTQVRDVSLVLDVSL
ncbi:hypothetical protein TWF569_004481 [Orbilia oligospora]|uniref:FCP1 homology domain-containing protein n=1 Tax=Orbilia oligospora TaxID=2813651 RepID=A0A7C8P0N0_ORBOL|nr:hypothetical protein TWF102_001739 [Orbilia oligospora]KAF3083819.1 hypothetical protein TWF706_001091 [Orbilia oligospora]KAF3090225.1 hypothetical protein TWF103_011950 [Orbilia oligospora]KAF3118988.1 hypothetical protein TWF569_004481 [Orbilia oligospora]KAF3130206.1 hypothetical protein TWF594_010445 [Orbilia oligospora]